MAAVRNSGGQPVSYMIAKHVKYADSHIAQAQRYKPLKIKIKQLALIIKERPHAQCNDIHPITAHTVQFINAIDSKMI